MNNHLNLKTFLAKLGKDCLKTEFIRGLILENQESEIGINYMGMDKKIALVSLVYLGLD
jgi:hypothetical protein